MQFSFNKIFHRKTKIKSSLLFVFRLLKQWLESEEGGKGRSFERGALVWYFGLGGWRFLGKGRLFEEFGPTIFNDFVSERPLA